MADSLAHELMDQTYDCMICYEAVSAVQYGAAIAMATDHAGQAHTPDLVLRHLLPHIPHRMHRQMGKLHIRHK